MKEARYSSNNSNATLKTKFELFTLTFWNVFWLKPKLFEESFEAIKIINGWTAFADVTLSNFESDSFHDF